MKKKPGTPKHPPVPSNFAHTPHNVETTQPPVARDSSFSSSLKTAAVGKKKAAGVPRKKRIAALGEVSLPDTLLRQLAAGGFDTRSLLGAELTHPTIILLVVHGLMLQAHQPQPDSPQPPTKYLHPSYPQQQQYLGPDNPGYAGANVAPEDGLVIGAASLQSSNKFQE